MSKGLTALALALALTVPGALGHAQQAQPEAAAGVAAQPPLDVSQLREFEDIVVPHLGVEIDRLKRMDIVGPTGEEVGAVDEILVDRDNRVVAIAAELESFFGLGDREVVIPLEQLAVQTDRKNLSITMTPEQLKALPQWDD